MNSNDREIDLIVLTEALADHMFDMGLDAEMVGAAGSDEIVVADKHGHRFIVKVEEA